MKSTYKAFFLDEYEAKKANAYFRKHIKEWEY